MPDDQHDSAHWTWNGMGWNGMDGTAGIKLIYPAEARVNCFRHMYRFGIHLMSFLSFAFNPRTLTQPTTVQLRLFQEIIVTPYETTLIYYPK